MVVWSLKSFQLLENLEVMGLSINHTRLVKELPICRATKSRLFIGNNNSTLNQNQAQSQAFGVFVERKKGEGVE